MKAKIFRSTDTNPPSPRPEARVTKVASDALNALLRIVADGGTQWRQGDGLPSYDQARKHVEIARKYLEQYGR